MKRASAQAADHAFGVAHVDVDAFDVEAVQIPFVAARFDQGHHVRATARRARTTADPMNPAAPVTAIRSPSAIETVSADGRNGEDLGMARWR